MASAVNALCWTTDPHLEFVSQEERALFAQELNELFADVILITGDIAAAPILGDTLALLANTISKNIYFVLGNHDFYGSSFQKTEDAVHAACSKHGNLHRLTGNEIIDLDGASALIGTDGWADGVAGSGQATTVDINDFRLIRDFARLLDNRARFHFMNDLAFQFTQTLRPTLEIALKQHQTVFLGTHFPPFSEAAWHQGHMSEPDYLPFFASPTMGKMLVEVASHHPTKLLKVLCGHCHSEGRYRHQNIVVDTGGATYGTPKINAVINLVCKN